MSTVDCIFTPRSIAVVGASADPKKMSHWLIRNVAEGGFQGSVYPISRRETRILGYPAFASLAEINEPVDLVLVSVASHHVHRVVSDAAKQGAKSAVILSAGFAEMAGERGKAAEAQILQTARHAGIRLMGPNCIGVYNGFHGLNGTFFATPPVYRGNISIISQSGAFAGILINEANRRCAGIGKVASVGNQLDLSHQELIEYFGNDDQTDVIGLYLEGVKDGGSFLSAIRKVSQIKPVVIFKAGRTRAGKRAAISHTGALAGDYQVAKAAFKQAGGLIAEDSEAFFDALFAFAAYRNRLPQGEELAIITISGGPSVAASDRCEEIGLRLAQFEPSTQEFVVSCLPDIATLNNPLDMTVSIPPDQLKPCIDSIIKDPQVAGAISINWGWDPVEFAEAFVNASALHQKPVLAFASENEAVQQTFRENGIMNFPSPERAADGFGMLLEYNRQRQKTLPSPGWTGAGKGPALLSEYAQKGNSILDEFETKQILSAQGIPCCREELVKTLEEAQGAAKQIGYPVVLKVCAREIAHKSEKGGVATGITDAEALRRAWKEMSSAFSQTRRFLLQEQVAAGIEIIVGIKFDETFGPTIAFGLGGIWAELYRDVSLRVCPLSRADALEMIREIQGYPALKGWRGRPGADEAVLCDILLRIGELGAAAEVIAEMDINPLIVNGSSTKIVDAMIVLRPLPES